MIERVDDIGGEWEAAAKQIARAMHKFDLGYGLDRVRKQLEAGHAELWKVDDKAYIVTRIVNQEEHGVLDCWLCAGRGSEEWLAAWFDYIAKYAEHWGCKYIEVTGRKGWVRQLMPHGFTEYCTTIRREV